MPRIEHLLRQLSQRTVSLAGAQVELARLAQIPGQDPQRLIALVQNAVTQGHLDQGLARALLDTIGNAADRTQAAKDRPTSAKDQTASHTLIPSADETLLPDEGRTARSARTPESTPMHSAPAAELHAGTRVRDSLFDDELTIRKPRSDADATGLISDPPRGLDPEATMRARASSLATAARTLHAPELGVGASAAYAQTLHAPEKEHIVSTQPEEALDDPSAVPHHGELQPGSVIKQRFLLDSMIGKGGMGLVFSAIDRRKEEARDPNPRVALKILNADFQKHPQSFIALQREARKAQTLAHPNVVTVFDFDRDGDAVYMTMELLKGRPLEAMVREARGKGIGRDLALPIIRGIAEGLAYAHRKGIVHSDLKPGNIFITSDDTPKILDFGIARAVPNPASEESPDMFDAGSLGAYTEAYATNEMVNGIDPHPADDMYALGIIGYELLTGFHPFQRHSAPSARKLGIKPAPLKGVKRKEARALERCLSFEREDRPKNAGEFLRLFRGVSTLQKATLTATAVLAIASGYLWYENYLETSPSIPLSKLPTEIQQQFSELIRDGDEAWGFYEREQVPDALDIAVNQYAKAYALHPRNRDAVRRLNRTADEVLKIVAGPEDRRKAAAQLQEHSDYYRKYQPVVDAAE